MNAPRPSSSPLDDRLGRGGQHEVLSTKPLQATSRRAATLTLDLDHPGPIQIFFSQENKVITPSGCKKEGPSSKVPFVPSFFPHK